MPKTHLGRWIAAAKDRDWDSLGAIVYQCGHDDACLEHLHFCRHCGDPIVSGLEVDGGEARWADSDVPLCECCYNVAAYMICKTQGHRNYWAITGREFLKLLEIADRLVENYNLLTAQNLASFCVGLEAK